MGEKVRFDGQHKKNAFVLESLGPHVRWVSVCPEVEAGFSIPRESIRLVQGKKTIEAHMGGTVVTATLSNFSEAKAKALAAMGLRGFILKKGSPSCGLERVRVYTDRGLPCGTTQGLFASALVKAFPNLPVEEEGRLKDAKIRENFIERVFAYDRLEKFFDSSWTLAELIAFHTAHKLQLLAHCPETYRQLGRRVAEAKNEDKDRLRTEYSQGFMRGLRKMASTGRNTNTLEHIAGYIKHDLAASEKKELCALIREYRLGYVPLVAPLTLLNHYIRKFEIRYLLGQTYLEPSPRELMLRTHVG